MAFPRGTSSSSKLRGAKFFGWDMMNHICRIDRRHGVTHTLFIVVIHGQVVPSRQCHMVLQEYLFILKERELIDRAVIESFVPITD